MSQNRASAIGGTLLILLGLVFLANLFFPGAWAVLLIGAGIFVLALSFIWRKGDFTTTGTVNLALGGILLYQSITQNWASWFYLWPVVFAAVGAGMLLLIPLRPFETWTRGRYLRVSLAFTVLGLLAAAGLWLVRDQLSWPVLVWGMGVLFALVGVVSGVSPLLIPATILGGIGGLLAYQNASGDWASWAYVWALIPGFVGLSLFLAFLRSRVMRIVGLSMLGWSMVVFTIFGLVFAREGELSKYWPLALVVAGLVILVQTSVRPSRHDR